MSEAVQYNELTRELFTNPVHAGDLVAKHQHTVEADVGESATGARIALAAGLQGGRIGELRFRAWGCPHLIAALEAACAELEGRPLDALKNWKTDNITQELSVPIEKSGRILLLEDALAMLWAQAAGAGA